MRIGVWRCYFNRFFRYVSTSNSKKGVRYVRDNLPAHEHKDKYAVCRSDDSKS